MIKQFLMTSLTASALLLTSCMASTTQTETSDKSTPTTVVDLSKYSEQPDFCPKVTKKVVQNCTQKNGSLQKQGRAQCYTCTIEYKDSGKACSGSADCMGDCYNYGEPVPLNIPNQTGQCAGNNIVFGCHQKIENGMSKEAMMCVD